MVQFLFSFVKIIFIIIAFLLFVVFFFQEHIIFFPEKLSSTHQFNFVEPFEEVVLETTDQVKIHGLLFKTDQPKGLVFYLHGNAGSLDSWGAVAPTFTQLGYDIFLLDYRGFGKSEGKIKSQKQLFQDNQLAYDYLKKQYPEDQIILLGYSIGSGFAAKLAATNQPRLLILQAPYYNMADLMEHKYPFLPKMLLRYKFKTNEYLPLCTMPIYLFHGKEDQVIYPESSKKLHELVPDNSTLIYLDDQGHNGMTDHPQYLMEIKEILF